ncbi:hypothetical protein SAMN05421787_11290 [Virgibacillus pantothenticus]|nr:hypothetical protein SAMN05421787_11290 [Virgibacillus pantothenticus]
MKVATILILDSRKVGTIHPPKGTFHPSVAASASFIR